MAKARSFAIIESRQLSTFEQPADDPLHPCAQMLDTFKPLLLTKQALALDDGG